MKNWLRLLLTALLSISIFPINAISEELVQIKVGVILPLTGNVAPYGMDVRDALLFANEKIANNKFKFIFEDDQCNGKGAVAAASKLLNIDHVTYGIIVCTESMLAAAPIFETHKTLVITPIASGAAVSNIGDYSFRTWPSDAGAAKVLFDAVAKSYKKVGIISEGRSNSEEMAKAFRSLSAQNGVDLVEVNYLSEQSDFSTLLLRLKNSNIEALFINAAAPPPFLVILKQVKQLGWNVPIFGAYFPADQALINSAGDMADGIVFVDAPPLEKVLTRDGLELFEQYKKIYGAPKSTPLIFASTFEVARLLEMVSQQQLDPREYLYKASVDGIIGRYSFDKNGDIVGLTHILRSIDKGNIVEFVQQ